MIVKLSNDYALIWQIKNAENYRFTQDGICINVKTNRIIKKTMCGRSIGYCINGKFLSVTSLRKKLEKINTSNCPF